MKYAALLVALLLLPSCGLYRSVLENSEGIKSSIADISAMVSDGKAAYDGIKGKLEAADTDGDGSLSAMEWAALVGSVLGGGGILARNKASDKRKQQLEQKVAILEAKAG